MRSPAATVDFGSVIRISSSGRCKHQRIRTLCNDCDPATGNLQEIVRKYCKKLITKSSGNDIDFNLMWLLPYEHYQ
jgi:hypothetical protein